MEDTIIRINNLKKRYMLGAIGGKTLNAEIQSWWARKLGKEDPNLRIGEERGKYGDSFLALDGINLEVKKGEALGIIGANGAGKSTLLKVLSRVTAPTEGDIWIKGRISSMLEVGTGFHGELTGRENIYMNGAILGMTRKEVDSKIESIIDFSECRQFIDTPVKRYSSGMYVKLAFAVASHLDAEIMIMDEVLAVGDMAFQKKCLGRMGDEAKGGKTVLYVSHNMSTIRNLCNRCIVLNKGHIIFDGDVEKAISLYMNGSGDDFPTLYEVSDIKRDSFDFKKKLWIKSVSFIDKGKAIYESGEKIKLLIRWSGLEDCADVKLRVAVKYAGAVNVGMAESEQSLQCTAGEDYESIFEYDASNLCSGIYYFKLFFFVHDPIGNVYDLDGAMSELYFELVETENNKSVWLQNYWGNVRLNRIQYLGDE